MITPELIARINALAKQKKAQGLVPEEQQEQDRLRRIYLDHIKAQLHDTLSRVRIVDADAAPADEADTRAPRSPGSKH